MFHGMGEQFFDEYNHRGTSVRGPREDIERILDGYSIQESKAILKQRNQNRKGKGENGKDKKY